MDGKIDILNFREMNDLYQYINVPVQTTNPNLHIYRFSDFTKDSIESIQPHTKDFHQVSFIQGFGSSELNINHQKVNELNSVLYFISPNHVYSWVRDQNIEGYILNFKQDYLSKEPADFQSEFLFFELDKLNAIPIDQEENQRVVDIFDEFFSEYHQPRNSFSEKILRHYLQVVLYKCLDLYRRREKTIEALPKNQGLFVKYKNLINNYYLSKRSIKEYAALLNVTPNHLSETIKSSTGKNALYYINQRLLLEAKNLLRYGHEDIKQIAYTLNFASPSHFGKFFKKQTRQTPATYRKEHQSQK
ncbi:helix-turn-helix domain-containing protein [Flagellimonas meridianipacifica]|uniref:AraC-like DNA-binding protein n=1 Tax=Flagellimonas meridianipacifica TaxID=1080225 RepID=A0A2T0MHA2_9FLAO|nr:helix-turn-helix domain-containing protein [Allomuricauda pacifica]PRX56953.1 AraC-like DNA-binding protein [Allomuricauda pacifica]